MSKDRNNYQHTFSHYIHRSVGSSSSDFFLPAFSFTYYVDSKGKEKKKEVIAIERRRFESIISVFERMRERKKRNRKET